ncbi:hypothetical protein GL503_07750 [Salmonella enterica]|nr:hypothetical protein [Salmonella enterica]
MTFLRLKINQSSALRKIILRDVLTHAQKLAYRSGVAPHWATGFSSLNSLAGSRYVSVKRYFYARKTTYPRIMAGCSGEALRPAGFQTASLLTPLRLATTFSSVMARLHKLSLEAANMANSTHPQIVYLPLVDAVDTGASREWQLMQQTEINLLYRVKRALDRAGVEWIDTRTGETSPVKTDNAEGCDNA